MTALRIAALSVAACLFAVFLERTVGLWNFLIVTIGILGTVYAIGLEVTGHFDWWRGWLERLSK